MVVPWTLGWLPRPRGIDLGRGCASSRAILNAIVRGTLVSRHLQAGLGLPGGPNGASLTEMYPNGYASAYLRRQTGAFAKWRDGLRGKKARARIVTRLGSAGSEEAG